MKTRASGRGPIEKRLQRANSQIALPSIYRSFVESGQCRLYRRAFIRGLATYGQTDVELNLNRPILRSKQLLEESGVNAADAARFHPIATLPQSPQFLAIDVTLKSAPVYLWHHETGAFYLQFDTFLEFVATLKTPREQRRDRARNRLLFAAIRKECKPALLRARRWLGAGNTDEAGKELDAVLKRRRPIEYDGSNDFTAISLLCDCFNLRGRVFLAATQLKLAQIAFLDAVECGGSPYWEAVVNAAVTSCLLESLQPVSHLRSVERSDFSEPPGAIARRNFTMAQIERVKQVARSSTRLSPSEREFAARVLAWISEA